MATPSELMSKHKILSREDEQELARRVQRGDEQARQDLAAHNTRLVFKIANDYAGNGVDVEELTSPGTVGLMKAVDKFDPERGFRFSTYATWWIRQSITRAISDYSRTIRLPEQARSELHQLHEARTEAHFETGRNPSVRDLAERTGLPSDRIRALESSAQVGETLDQPLAESEGPTLGDLIPDEHAHDPHAVINAAMRDERLMAAMIEYLEPHQRAILFMHAAGKTLQNIGDEWGYSRERVRQLEIEALDKLQGIELSQVSLRGLSGDPILREIAMNTETTDRHDAELKAATLAVLDYRAAQEQLNQTGERLEKWVRELAMKHRKENEDQRNG